MKQIDGTQLSNEIIHTIVGGKNTIVGGSHTYDYMQLKPKEKGKLNLNDKNYKVTCDGFLSVEEAGGRERVMVRLGIESPSSSKFQIFKDWLEGFGKLYVYTIEQQ